MIFLGHRLTKIPAGARQQILANTRLRLALMRLPEFVIAGVMKLDGLLPWYWEPLACPAWSEVIDTRERLQCTLPTNHAGRHEDRAHGRWFEPMAGGAFSQVGWLDLPP